MAILEIALTQNFENVECISRFTYQSTGTPAASSLSFLLMRGFGAIPNAGVYPPTALLARIAAAQSTFVTYTGVAIRNLYSTTDFYSLPTLEELQGGVIGEALPPFVALGFSSSRVRADIRRGTKRFVGVPESQVGSAGALTSGYLTGLVADLAASLGAIITETDEGNTITFTPVVLGRQRYNPSTQQPDPEGTAWRYYPTEAEQLQHVAAGTVWSAYTTVRSQTTRQYGRGR